MTAVESLLILKDSHVVVSEIQRLRMIQNDGILRKRVCKKEKGYGYHRKPLPVGVDDFEMLVTRGYYFYR